MLKKLLSVLAGVALVVAQISPAYAQIAPGSQEASTPATTSSSSSAGVVMLADYIEPGRVPLAARQGDLGVDTPVYTREQFFAAYQPGPGQPPAAQVYDRISAANRSLCDQGYEMMNLIATLDMQFAESEISYEQLLLVYEALPRDVKRATAVMTGAQAVSTGALCLLSAGLYCIAAAAGGIGNIFTSQANKKLQLANIKLSIQNILVTRLNIQSNRLTLRMDAFWLDLAVPYCQKVFPGMDSAYAGSFSSALPPLSVQARPNVQQQPVVYRGRR